jgi:hypothetical protein
MMPDGIPLGQYLQERIQEALAPLHRQLADEQRRLVETYGTPQLSGAEFDAALEEIRARCEAALAHLGCVVVTSHDRCAAVGVGLTLHERIGRWRHGVMGESRRVVSDPKGFADMAITRLLAWHSRHMEPEGPRGIIGDEEAI